MGQVQAQELQGETTEPRHRIRTPPSDTNEIYQLTSLRGREGDYLPLPLVHPDDLLLEENIGWGASGEIPIFSPSVASLIRVVSRRNQALSMAGD